MGIGTTHYYEDARKAATQASLDVAAYAAKGSATGATETWQDTWSAVGSMGSALVGLGTLGVQIASLVMSRHPPKPPEAPPDDAFHVEVLNNTSFPVVTYGWEVQGADVARIPRPLGPGEKDLVLITNTNDGFADDTFVRLTMLVGTGGDAVVAAVKYDYTDTGTPGRWRISAGLASDGVLDHDFDKDLELVGGSFVADPATESPSFSFYTVATETGTGTVALVLYDYAAPPA
ncbi:MAG TPA: hypothetical protein VF519_07950 [Mycobacteriales bacterium]|jgi:hypothetical protein